MKQIVTIIMLWIILVLSNGAIHAQGSTPQIFTADSLKSGNYKDALTSFFQLALNNITGPNKELRFNSNPFAIMFKGNKALAIDTNWIKYRRLRDLNFSISLKTDSNSRINKFSGGLKYALMNKRDVTISKSFFYQQSHSTEGENLNTLQVSIGKIASTIKGNPTFSNKYDDETRKLTEQGSTVTYSDLSKDVRDYISLMADSLKLPIMVLLKQYPTTNLLKALSFDYDSAKAEFLMKPLWTVAIDGSSYSEQFVFSNVLFSTQFLAGVASNRRHTMTYELDLRAQYDMRDDSLKTGRDLDRQVFSFEPGVNLALRGRLDNKSFFEFKLGGGYYHTFSTLHNMEKADVVTLNAEIRLRVYDDIWVPIAVKYDPDKQNLLGFLNVSANFTGISNLFGKKLASQ